MSEGSLKNTTQQAGFASALIPVEGPMGEYLGKNKQTILMTMPAISRNSLFHDQGILCLIQDNETGDKTILYGRRVKLFDEDHFYVLKGANINRVENFNRAEIFVEHTGERTRHLIFEVPSQSQAAEFVTTYKDDAWVISSSPSQNPALITQ